MNKSPLSIEKLKKTIKALKPLGLIDYGISDLKNLSPQQKGAITRKYNKLRHYVNHPEEFAVKKTTTKTAKNFKQSGYVTSKTNKVLIPLKGNEKASVKGASIVFTKGKRKETVYLSTDAKSLAKNVKKAASKKGLLGFKIGENSTASSQFTNIKDLNNYLANTLYPKFEMSPEKFKALVSLVQFENDKGKQNDKKKQSRKNTPKNRRN